MSDAEAVARRFHWRYEALAPEHGWKTRSDSARPWDEVPENNRALMIAVAESLLGDGVIVPGPALRPSTFPGEPTPALSGQEPLDDVGEPG